MICEACRRHIQGKSNLAYVLIMKAILAFEKGGFICYDERLGRYNAAVELLEHAGYIISTEHDLYEIAYQLDEDLVQFIDPGYYCWCHMHKKVVSNG